MCYVYDGLEPHNHYEPQQDTNNPIPSLENFLFHKTSEPYLEDKMRPL
jgi:hypothetical protein